MGALFLEVRRFHRCLLLYMSDPGFELRISTSPRPVYLPIRLKNLTVLPITGWRRDILMPLYACTEVLRA